MSLFLRCHRKWKAVTWNNGVIWKGPSFYYYFPYLSTNLRMNFSILVSYCWRAHQSPLKSWRRKFASSNLEAIMHCYKSLQTSAAWKEARSCNGRGQEGISKVGRPKAALRTPFLRKQAALGCSSTCSYTFLLASVVCSCCQKHPRRGLGGALSGNKKSLECGSWPHKCEDVHSPSRDSHFPFHITTCLLSKGNPLSLGTVAENISLKLRWYW